MNLSDYLKILSDKKNLSEEEAENLADMLLENNFDETIAGSILTALKVKGESADEIIGFIKSLRKHASNLGIENAIDIVGTGGDGLSTINVSTTVSILLSNLIPVAKHGNRAASSKSGSADFLESLGYNIYIEPNNAANLLKKNNFVFLFAQLYHKSMKNVAIIRKKLGIRSIFNFIGPFANPANVKVQLVGVYPISYLDVLADAASRLNYEKIILINGEPGLDEVSPVGESFIVEVKKDKIDKYKISINDFKVNKVNISNLIVNSPEE
ncbi:MAG: anthranilate phosphoribosyltransferase, partial [Caldisphaera sp.]|nr:anthranilate phosphoribosyltransferase [Caldisphaera sp.]